MCGIYLTLENDTCNCDNLEAVTDKLCPLLRRRGPNKKGDVSIKIGQVTARFHGTLLWLRGSKPQPQPLEEADGSVLLWNGDLFHTDLPSGISDTELLAQKLSTAISENNVLDTFANLEGPGAFIYFSAKFGKLWFGRDYFGRHSLLVRKDANHCVLTSVGCCSLDDGNDLRELPAFGFFEMIIDGGGGLESSTITLIPWLNRTVQSTGMDLPFGATVDSVRFLKPKLSKLCQTETTKVASSIEDYLDTLRGSDAVDGIIRVLGDAVQVRMEAQPGLCKDCVESQLSCHDSSQMTQCTHPKVGILFSGGLDSVVIAALAGKCSSSSRCFPAGEEIDLLNVAFEQENGSFDVPDRQTALQAMEELKVACPEVSFNLILVNVTKCELQKSRRERICDLLYPLDTVLDDSIGCAIWFASRARGILCSTGETYMSPVRILLLGMGADEQLGGYSRHKVAFNKSGRIGLLAELQRQLDGISERNLGRDNRIVSDHGVAGRYPYLDERVVNFLNSLTLEVKMDLSLPRGQGDKLILRAAALKLGLPKTALEPKRAIQFGSRIAKLENRREKATDKAVR
jgi:asparagine synthetase B (glutamine-hydrolysing)